MPGIEITTDLGHFNVHGPKQTLEKPEANFTVKSLIEAGLAIGEQGHIAINHPISDQAINYQVEMSRYRWLRVDIRRKNGEFEGLINPVFNGEHPCFISPSIHTWGQLMAVITKNATVF